MSKRMTFSKVNGQIKRFTRRFSPFGRFFYGFEFKTELFLNFHTFLKELYFGSCHMGQLPMCKWKISKRMALSKDNDQIKRFTKRFFYLVDFFFDEFKVQIEPLVHLHNNFCFQCFSFMKRFSIYISRPIDLWLG